VKTGGAAREVVAHVDEIVVYVCALMDVFHAKVATAHGLLAFLLSPPLPSSLPPAPLFFLHLHPDPLLTHTHPQIPLGRYFPEYEGGNDLQKAAKYILWKFMQENRAKLTVYPQ
jgi:hypothetical protein